MNRWMKRYDAVGIAFQKLKSMTKKVPASTWTPEYHELASAIHTMGRDYFHTGILTDMTDEGLYPKNSAGMPEKPHESAIEVAYGALGLLLAFFRNCPLCGRVLPGEHTTGCAYVRVYDEISKDRDVVSVEKKE